MAIQCIRDQLNTFNQYILLNIDDFCDVIKFYLNYTYFQFSAQYFSQMFGVAMDSPIVATVANIVVEHV